MKILVVEDDRTVAEMLKESFAADSHAVEIADDGASGSFMIRNYPYDAIVLDYALPKKNGLQLCREVRASGRTTPIVFLSANTDTSTKIAALEEGADDYLTKPFSMIELRARLKAVARRPSEIRTQNILRCQDIVMDTDKQTVFRGHRKIVLTRKEFNLLEYLIRNAGTVLSRAAVMEKVWTSESNPFSNTVEAHIRNLRRKLGVGRMSNIIRNMPGRGYVIGN